MFGAFRFLMNLVWAMLLLGISNEGFIQEVSSYSTKTHRYTRRGWMQVSFVSFVAVQHPRTSYAKAPIATNPLENLVEAQETLDTLLTNYERATTDCTFADVPRELLESKNKALIGKSSDQRTI